MPADEPSTSTITVRRLTRKTCRTESARSCLMHGYSAGIHPRLTRSPTACFTSFTRGAHKSPCWRCGLVEEALHCADEALFDEEELGGDLGEVEAGGAGDGAAVGVELGAVVF